jgi:hypothetical protein
MRTSNVWRIVLPFMCCLASCATYEPFDLLPSDPLAPYCSIGDKSPFVLYRMYFAKGLPDVHIITQTVTFRLMPDGEIRDMSASSKPEVPELDELLLTRMRTLKCGPNPVAKAPLGSRLHLIFQVCKYTCPLPSSSAQ